MPSAELFFDFCWTFPDAKFILTTRPALEWAKSRKLHLPYSSFAPIEEPCGYYIDDFADEVSAKLFEHHNDLVRCMVPKERFFEINVWTDSEEKLQNLSNNLASFVGGTPNGSFPGTNIRLRLVSEGDMKEGCTAQLEIAGKFRASTPHPPSDTYATLRVQIANTMTLVHAEHLGILMHYAATSGCELVPEDVAQS